jgi:hypothetical protein
MIGGVYAATALASAKDDTQPSASAPNSRPRSVRSECVRRSTYVRELLRPRAHHCNTILIDKYLYQMRCYLLK